MGVPGDVHVIQHGMLSNLPGCHTPSVIIHCNVLMLYRLRGAKLAYRRSALPKLIRTIRFDRGAINIVPAVGAERVDWMQYVPLVSLTDQLGPTMYRIGSHLQQELNESQPAMAILAPIGSVVMWDYRTVHWGTPNYAQDAFRHVMYLAVARTWFHDLDNRFPKCSLFAHNCSCKNSRPYL